jgi:hypothetical protein
MIERTFIPSYAEEALQSLNTIAAYENDYPETSDTQYTEALQNLSLNAHSLGFTDLMQWADEKLEAQKQEEKDAIASGEKALPTWKEWHENSFIVADFQHNGGGSQQ